MAALDFPDAPTNGQVFDKWTWNGTAWLLTASGGGLSQAAADLLYVNIPGDTMTGALLINSGAVGTLPLMITGFAGQTAQLTRWRNSALATVAAVESNGDVRTRRVAVLDGDATHHLFLMTGSNLTVDRTLSFNTQDASRVLTLTADVALNQNLRTTDEATFLKVHITGTGAKINMNKYPIHLNTDADGNHRIYTADLSATTPYVDGPIIEGWTGFAFKQNNTGGVWRVGFRGGHTYPYLWVNGALSIGSLPADGPMTLPGKIYASNNVSATQCEGRGASNANYDSAAILANPGGFTAGSAAFTLHPGGAATQIRQAYNDGSPYFRNLNDTGYPQVFMDVTDMSSLRYKEQVRSLVDDRVRGTPQSSLNIVRQLRPIRYRVRKEQRLIRTDFTIHECGEDCIGPDAPNYTTENTCPQYRSWERGTAGFVAEELDVLLPEASMRNAHDEPEGVKTLAIVAVLTDAIQELITRVEQLEGGA